MDLPLPLVELAFFLQAVYFYIQSLLQYNNQSDEWSMNWRFIWQQSAATGLYIVYNEAQDYDGIPITKSTKSFVLKYSYLFDIMN